MYNKYTNIVLGQHSLVSFHLTEFLCGCNVLLAYLHGCQKTEIKITQLFSNSSKPKFCSISNCKPYTLKYDQLTIFLSFINKSSQRTLREVKVEVGHIPNRISHLC